MTHFLRILILSRVRQTEHGAQRNCWISLKILAAFAAEETTAHRLFSGPDAWVERLGPDVLVSFKTDSARDEALTGLREWESLTGFQSARVFSRFLPRQNAERVAPVLVTGDPAASLDSVVSERGVRYGIDFGAGYSAGLFIDQRANRARVQRMAPKRMLNTFAYTCSFSVAAAIAGAQTLSIDLSKKSLDRGRGNFELNNLPPDGHRFLADDVLDVLPRLERRGEKFDLLILDPPTFSLGNKGRRWRVEEQIEDLLRIALEISAPGASLLVSTNCTKLDRATLERTVRFMVKTARLGGDISHEPTLPDFPPGEGAQTLWLKLK
ncbi:MAG: class I SAM-dependent methyltransferase [Verrucomicrobia bacterium]|nr:class I SAM-dependent methyltransferase [Verrucomicrobiota bacterium]